MATNFCVTGNPSKIPDVGCVIIPMQSGDTLKGFGACFWVASKPYYITEISKNRDTLHRGPILIDPLNGAVDIIVIEDDMAETTVVENLIFRALSFAQDNGYAKVALQLFRSGKELFPRPEHEAENAISMVNACNSFPTIDTVVCVTAFERYAFLALQTNHVPFLGYWHEETNSFQST